MSDERSASPALAFTSHNHRDCTADLRARADALAKEQGARLTPVRRRVLEILLEEHRAMGAYDVLKRLSAEGFGKQPPIVYRALEFLVSLGVVHRINRLNAFTACTRPGQEHRPVFWICQSCQAVAESPGEAAQSALESMAGALGFSLQTTHIEATGTCPKCTPAPCL